MNTGSIRYTRFYTKPILPCTSAAMIITNNIGLSRILLYAVATTLSPTDPFETIYTTLVVMYRHKRSKHTTLGS